MRLYQLLWRLNDFTYFSLYWIIKLKSTRRIRNIIIFLKGCDYVINESNMDIRDAAKKAGVYLWQIAEIYGLSDVNFSKLLRKELPQKKKDKILEIIKKITKEDR